MIQHTLTLKMTSTQVVKTSVTLNNNSPIQDYVHPDDHTQPTYGMTPGLKPFTIPAIIIIIIILLLLISSFLEIDFAINISDKKSRRFDLSEVIFKCIKVL